MCGIFCTVIYNKNTFLNEIAKKGNLKQTNQQFADYCTALKNRGPDSYKELIVEVSPFTILQFAGCVLWTQGTDLIPQPYCSEESNILLWNGDIFSGELAGADNDTKNLFNKLEEAGKKRLNIVQVFTQIRGPYSFIYYEKEKKVLYFGRDIVGRHSLLINFGQMGITISSVASRKVKGFFEVPARGIFSINLEKDGEMPITFYPWSHFRENILDAKYFLPGLSADNIKIGEIISSCLRSSERRTKNPSSNDLEMWTIQDQDFSVNGFLQKLSFSDAKSKIKKTMSLLIEKPTIKIIVEDFLITLKKSVNCRVEKQPKFCKNCIKDILSNPYKNIKCLHSKLAILFSGGLDSAVLASLAHQCLPLEEPIDLLNVAFEKVQNLTSDKDSTGMTKQDLEKEDLFQVPDRITGMNTLNELKRIYANRKWNFVEINITQKELNEKREEIIANLIYPLNTVLDDSLGCALWFASRGHGFLKDCSKIYKSPARIIFSGIGADEQLGGYMRHRTLLKNRGNWEALDKELQFEINRISQRNLGRDDRIVGDHGRQLRMPFLDEDVINFLNFLPPWNRCYPVDSMPPGLGDKLLLRLVAWELGLRDAANIPKRAMQFGSKIANSREKGNDYSDRLLLQ